MDFVKKKKKRKKKKKNRNENGKSHTQILRDEPCASVHIRIPNSK